MMIDRTLRTFRPESRLSYELQELVQYSEMRSVNLVKFYVVEQEWPVGKFSQVLDLFVN